MDERINRTERTSDVTTDYDRDVDIRRSMIMGRDMDAYGRGHYTVVAPMHRAIHWGPIFAGLTATMVLTLLLGSLFVGLGFTPEAGAFGGLTAQEVGIGTIVVSLLAVFIGSYLTGFVSDLRAKSEGILNGFMVGVMSILTPLILGTLGLFGAANVASNAVETAPTAVDNQANAIGNAVPPSVADTVQNALTVAADNAWTVFLGGLLILGVATLAGYLGCKSREKGIEASAKHEVEKSATSSY